MYTDTIELKSQVKGPKPFIVNAEVFFNGAGEKTQGYSVGKKELMTDMDSLVKHVDNAVAENPDSSRKIFDELVNITGNYTNINKTGPPEPGDYKKTFQNEFRKMIDDEVSRRKVTELDEKNKIVSEIAQKTMTYLDHVYQHTGYNLTKL